MKLKRLLFNNLLCFKATLILIMACYSYHLSCQLKYDYNWVIATSSNGIPGIDAFIIDFSGGKRSLREISAYNRVHDGNAVISNREGELQFFTNGCEIMDTLGGIIMNGDTLIPGYIYDSYCFLGVYPSIQNSTILPDLNNENYYYYLQKERILSEFQGNLTSLFPTLRSSKIYSDENTKEVLERSVIVDSVGYRFSSNFETILHSNGVDWWIVDYLIKEDGGKRLLYLLDENGVNLIKEEIYENQNALTKIHGSGGQACFAPNGEIYAKYDSFTGLDLFNFNRATGEFTNHKFIPTNLQANYSGMAFSPNSRFIYISSYDKLHQLDLWEENLEDGFELIGEYDGFLDPFPTNFTWMQLGPDCRIYMTSTNGVSSYHVINNPDKKGLECNFVQHGFELPIHNGTASIPNFPVFRFEDDEVCDPTITSLFDIPIEIMYDLDIFPNPTHDLISIAFPEELRHGKLFIKSMNGQVLFQQAFDYAGSQQVSLEDYQSGVYIIEVVSKDRRFASRVLKND